MSYRWGEQGAGDRLSNVPILHGEIGFSTDSSLNGVSQCVGGGSADTVSLVITS